MLHFIPSALTLLTPKRTAVRLLIQVFRFQPTIQLVLPVKALKSDSSYQSHTVQLTFLLNFKLLATLQMNYKVL